MTDWPPRLLREAALEKINALLAASPEAIEARFKRACLLAELGRTEEARSAYLDVLARAPAHFGALNNLGNLLYAQGYKTAARTLYMEAVAQHPDNPKGHYNLADLLAENNETELAMKHFEAALRIDPDHMEANRGMAYLLTELRDEKRAALYRQKAFRNRPVLVLPYCGEGTPIRLLLLVSALGGTIPMRHYLDERVFLVSVLFVEFYDDQVPLPPHQLVVNAIGDADLCRPALDAAIKIVAKTTAPVINQPSRVLLTGRAENAGRLARVQGVTAPRMSVLPRELLESAGAPSLLARQGFTFPLLLRSPGFHTGRFFERVQDKEALTASLLQMPGQELMVIQYLNAQSRDGKTRKYRVMMVGGVLYPLHVAISHEWKIHYFTAEMAEHPEHRAEDAAFLENMPHVLGPCAMEALEKIRDALGLDYGGIDFSLNADGEIILFEANATMVVHLPDKDARWDYRRSAVQRILDAVHRLLTTPAHTLPPVEALLTSGGDARIVCNPQGVTQYGCSPVPQPEVLAYSSSTASTISPAGFAASTQLYERLKEASRIEAASVTYAREMNRIRSELITLCDLTSLSGLEIIFGASGTDLHLFASQLLGKAGCRLLIIMPEASETGKGIPAALEGRHFSTQTALGSAAIPGEAITRGDGIEVTIVKSRLPDGSLRPETAVDGEVEALAVQAVAAGRHVLLTLTDVSKTGLIVPSPACAMALRRRFPAMIDILVDACQYRLANATIRAYLEQEFLLAMTGSKFVTGPAFCAALMIPRTLAQQLRTRALPAALSAYSACADWPEGWAAQAMLGDTANYGLLLRLEAMLTELRAFHSLPEARILPFLEAFAIAVQKRLTDDPVLEPLPLRAMDRQPLAGEKTWDHIPTIFPFLLRRPACGALLNRDETHRIYELMKQNLTHHPGIPAAMRQAAGQRCLLGQPVACGVRGGIPASALRLNIDMRLIVDALSPGGRGSDAVIAEALSVLDKTAMLVEYPYISI